MNLSFLSPYKIVIDILVITSLIGGGVWCIHLYNSHQQDIGATRVQVAWDKERAEQKEAARTRELQFQKDKDDAIAKSEIQRKALVSAANATVGANRLLDSTLQTISAGASTATRDALTASLTACTTVLSTMAKDGGRIAAEADSHAADSLMLQNAWPK